MKKINYKGLMVLTIIVASAFAMPTYSKAQPSTSQGPDEIGLGQIRNFGAGFGSLLGGLGHGGQLLGEVFGTLFMQGLDNLSRSEVIENTFVMSASRERNITRTYEANNEEEIYYLPYEYYDEDYNFTENGYAYTNVTKNGSYNYTMTVGAAVTLVIWDNDRSFVRAAERLIEFFNKLRTYEEQGTIEEHKEELISEGSEIITWFLIHINDIFTGDELFVLNPITYRNLYIDRSDYNVTKEWKFTGPDNEIDDDDYAVGGELEDWRTEAQNKKDSYTQWILQEPEQSEKKVRKFTEFTFDLMQLWVKNFHIEIDVGELLSQVTGEGQGNPARAFEGCNIDFFFFTHSLAGAFLYNDKNGDDQISVNYTTVKDEDGNPVETNGTVAKVPESSELTHRLILRDVEDFEFQAPTVDSQKKSVSWGLQMKNIGLSGVPIGVDLAEYEGDPAVNDLDYMYFGFTFEPKISEPILAADNSTVIQAANGIVKLDQFLAPWNDNENPSSKNDEFDGLDLSIIYVSTVLHFVLDIQTEDLSQEDTSPNQLANQTEYNDESHKLSIGNYLNPEIEAQLPFVDMAGPGYEYGTESSRTNASVSTSIMPTALWEGQKSQYEVFEGDEDTTSDDFGAQIDVTIDFNIMLYAINYPNFDGYNGIWHDPTFSVYMIFESQGFWALILLIAGVSLVGVATILMKRRKERQVNF